MSHFSIAINVARRPVFSTFATQRLSQMMPCTLLSMMGMRSVVLKAAVELKCFKIKSGAAQISVRIDGRMVNVKGLARFEHR